MAERGSKGQAGFRPRLGGRPLDELEQVRRPDKRSPDASTERTELKLQPDAQAVVERAQQMSNEMMAKILYGHRPQYEAEMARMLAEREVTPEQWHEIANILCTPEDFLESDEQYRMWTAVHAVAKPILDHMARWTAGQGMNAIGADIYKYAIDRARLEAEMKQEQDLEAALDPLTDILRNMEYVDRLGHLELRRLAEAGPSMRGIAIKIDIDNVKVLNESVGHDAVDNEVLRPFADVLKLITRKGDIRAAEEGGIPGRQGGDEYFAYISMADLEKYVAEEGDEAIEIFNDVTEEGAEHPLIRRLVSRIREEAAEITRPDGTPLSVTIGYKTITPDEARTNLPLSHYLHLADEAQVRAKREGDGTIGRWSEQMPEAEPRQEDIDRALEKAAGRTLVEFGVTTDELRAAAPEAWEALVAEATRIALEKRASGEAE